MFRFRDIPESPVAAAAFQRTKMGKKNIQVLIGITVVVIFTRQRFKVTDHGR